MEDDDTDFVPSSSRSTSSNLASLFGFIKQPLQGNSSLTYSAPKAPKREASPVKKQSEEKVKGEILLSKVVHAYKLVKRTYENQGVLGIVISGNHTSRIYEFILYKKSTERFIQIRISGSFTITLSPNKYVSFYDNNTQNWSIMFHSAEDVQEFSQMIAICKFYSHAEPLSDILVQDLEPATQQKTNPNSTVQVTYSVFSLTPEKTSKLKEDVQEKIKLSNYSFMHLSNGLIGCAEKCRRVIVIPHSLSGPWLNELGVNKDLLVEIKIEKIFTELEILICESKEILLDKLPESPIDSSAEETSVKARGASIKEALATTKSQKANLISRMARMGQATLPVKQGLPAGPSDSDEESALTLHPKPRMPRSRNASGNALSNSLSQTQESPQQLSLYQNDLAWHQAQLGKLGVAYQQLIPVSASAISSPTTDPNLSVYLSESRIQAAELRMGILKISEKLDLVWNKIQNMTGGGPKHKGHQQALMDPGGILTSIQNIIAENESLKEKVEEQKKKIEQQNDRIFNLLELNHRYLEQNSTTHEKQSANESKLKIEMESLQRKELEMEATHKMTLDRVVNLEGDLAKSEELNRELKKTVDELSAEADALKRNFEGNNDEKSKEVEMLKEKMTMASETVAKLKERLREVVIENEGLKSVIKTQKEEIETGNQMVKVSRTKNEEYEKVLEGLRKQILNEESRTGSKIESLSKVVAKLEEENKYLRMRVEREDEPREVKKVLLKILSALKDKFSDSEGYSASQILTAVSKVFNNEIEGSFKVEEKPEPAKTESAEPTVVPAPRTSLQTAEAKQEKKEVSPPKEVESKKEDNKDSDNQKKKGEVDSRYKSYDQGWRTDKPPPPPLFDDDDDDDEWAN